MHPTTETIFESLDAALLWLTDEGVVRYANAKAKLWTGLHPGATATLASLRDASRKVLATNRSVALWLPMAGSLDATLSGQALPGSGRDDVMVLLRPDQPSAAGGELDALMDLMRAELAAPLDELIYGLRGAIDRQDGAPMPMLIERAEEVYRGLVKLLELARVHGTKALEFNERIELSPLLERAWRRSAPMATARGLTLRMTAPMDGHTQVTVYGSADLLERALVDCLEALLRSAPARGTVDIRVLQAGPRVLIIFHDCGAFAPPRADLLVLDLNDKVHCARATRVHDAIGRQLCRRIIELHGGTLREEVNGDTCDFMIDLPTGGGVTGNRSASIQAGQVEQYARDLAQLMSRMRRAPPAGLQTKPTFIRG